MEYRLAGFGVFPIIACVLLLGVNEPVAQPAPDGPEFQVNTHTTGTDRPIFLFGLLFQLPTTVP